VEETKGIGNDLTEADAETQLQRNVESWIRSYILKLPSLKTLGLDVARERKPIITYSGPTFPLRAQDDLQIYAVRERETLVAIELKAATNAIFDGYNWNSVSPQVVVPLDSLSARGRDPALCVLSNGRVTWLFRLTEGSHWAMSGPHEGKDNLAAVLVYAAIKTVAGHKREPTAKKRK
jgi:hypothetical protein